MVEIYGCCEDFPNSIGKTLTTLSRVTGLTDITLDKITKDSFPVDESERSAYLIKKGKLQGVFFRVTKDNGENRFYQFSLEGSKKGLEQAARQMGYGGELQRIVNGYYVLSENISGKKKSKSRDKINGKKKSTKYKSYGARE